MPDPNTPEPTESKAANVTLTVVAKEETPKLDVPRYNMAHFEMPKFEMPKFEMPTGEVPAAFREFAEKTVAQAKDGYEKMKVAAEETTELLESAYSATVKGSSDYGLKMIEAARTNTNAGFDFARELMTVRSLAEMVELSSAHARKQFEAVSAQAKELTALAQKVATDASEPLKSGMNKAFKQAA